MDQKRQSGSSNTGWAYWRPEVDGIVEIGTLEGQEVGLPLHFHGEDQITFVFSGRRRFIIHGEIVALTPGQGALIPAGIAHRSLAEPSGVTCLNAYVPPGDYAAAAMMQDVDRLWRRKGHVQTLELAAVIREHCRGVGAGSATNCVLPTCTEPVSQVARRAGMSREGFSRRFAKHHGLPPHAFWLMARLNQARELLRTGEGIADVAAATGFADQSHFGGWFRRAFGVTPGLYRAGWSRSQTCQTRG